MENGKQIINEVGGIFQHLMVRIVDGNLDKQPGYHIVLFIRDFHHLNFVLVIIGACL